MSQFNQSTRASGTLMTRPSLNVMCNVLSANETWLADTDSLDIIGKSTHTMPPTNVLGSCASDAESCSFRTDCIRDCIAIE